MPLHPQVHTLLEGFRQAGGQPVEAMAIEDARATYRNVALLDRIEEVGRVDDRLVPSPTGDIPVRVYTPSSATAGTSGALLWFHGGGWVVGDLETADGTCRALANRSGAVVVSVDYRRAPEHQAPAALEDCLTVLAWTAENGELLGIDPTKLVVAGDSAGGNLAALVCQRARDEFGPKIAFQLLCFPVTDLTLTYPSIDENATGYFLTKSTMEWFVRSYLGDGDPADPAVSPLRAANLAGLPPAIVITAEFDPLRDEGEEYGARLHAAGVPTRVVRYSGQIHNFLGMGAVLDDAAGALDDAGMALREVLA